MRNFYRRSGTLCEDAPNLPAEMYFQALQMEPPASMSGPLIVLVLHNRLLNINLFFSLFLAGSGTHRLYEHMLVIT